MVFINFIIILQRFAEYETIKQSMLQKPNWS